MAGGLRVRCKQHGERGSSHQLVQRSGRDEVREGKETTDGRGGAAPSFSALIVKHPLRAKSFTPRVENPPEADHSSVSLALSLPSLSISSSLFHSLRGQWQSSSNYTVRLMVIGLTSLDRACLFDLPLSFSL